MKEKSGNQQKIAASKKRRRLRALILAGAALIIAVAAAGCSRKPSETTEKLSEKVTPEPTAVPTPTPTSAPTPTLALSQKPTVTPSGSGGRVTFTGTTAEASEAKVGDTVRFGSYEQDNDLSNGAEAIEWLVLDKQDGKLLLLSKAALDCKKYNEERKAVTWETCTLRSWLNGEFYNTAFRQAEQERILTAQVKNEDNPEYGTEGIEGGNDTKDKVFLLSIDEVLNYFDPDPDTCDPARPAKVTEYAKAQGGAAYNEVKDDLYHTTEYDGNGWWWLRSPGRNSYHAAEVGADGRVHCDGLDVNGQLNVVRPAFWLNPES